MYKLITIIFVFFSTLYVGNKLDQVVDRNQLIYDHTNKTLILEEPDGLMYIIADVGPDGFVILNNGTKIDYWIYADLNEDVFYLNESEPNKGEILTGIFLKNISSNLYYLFKI